MSLLHESSPGIPLKSLCELFGYSRQAYYKRDDQDSFAENAIEPLIVGWSLGPTLEAVYPLQALQMALATIDLKTACRLIHHSDRGCQYCCYAYVAELERRGISISMTESGDPLENAIAERANGIIRREWLYKMQIETEHKDAFADSVTMLHK